MELEPSAAAGPSLRGGDGSEVTAGGDRGGASAGAHLPAGASWMLSMPIALERREPRGPGRRRDGLFPGTSSACEAPLTGGTPGTGGTPRGDIEVPTSSTEPSPMALPRRPRRLPGTSSDWGRQRVTDRDHGEGGSAQRSGETGHWGRTGQRVGRGEPGTRGIVPRGGAGPRRGGRGFR